jgi:predicted RNA polymerase sigma factor
MLLTEARHPARATACGELVSLAEQDRTLWRADLIAEGLGLIGDAWAKGAVGEYQLQAAIAAVHAQAASAQETDWREILGLYTLLERVTGNPLVSLNRAIAVAMLDGPRAGLALLDELEQPLAGHHRLHAVRAHLLEQVSDNAAAIAEYRTAAERTSSTPEQTYLLTQAARLEGK